MDLCSLGIFLVGGIVGLACEENQLLECMKLSSALKEMDQTNRRLLQENSRLQFANKAKIEFISHLSHGMTTCL